MPSSAGNAAWATWLEQRRRRTRDLPQGSGHAVSAAVLARAVASTGSGVTIADATQPDLPLTYVNDAFTEMTGYSAEECLGRNCRFLQGPDTDRSTVAQIRAGLQEERDVRVVLLNTRKDGTPFHNELRLSPVRDSAGRVVQVIGVQHDVSQLIHAQHALDLDHHRALDELQDFQNVLAPAAIGPRPRLDIASVFVAAEQGVAGDFHLVLPGPGDSTILVVGDVMGHGLTAARRAMFVRASLATSAHYTDDPARLLAMANQGLVEKAGTSGKFVTAVCVVHDPQRQSVRWASAGHPIPLFLDTANPIGELGHIGVALGIYDDYGGTTGHAPLAPGQGILVATDGLAEARDAAAQPSPIRRLGDARIRDLIGQLSGQSAEDVAEALHTAAYLHADGNFADDLCLLVARAR